MKKSLTKLLTFTLTALSLGTLASFAQLNNASALVDTPWGPERTTYTWSNPAPYATWNSIIDNPSVGDERNFVRVREITSSDDVSDANKYTDSVTVTPGRIYEVYIYYHNNADAHEVGKTAIGIADGAAVKSSFPATIKKDEKATVTATIFASDTDPLAVWDGAYLTATQDLYLRYVPGTATIHNGGALNGSNIGADYLFGDGALIGYNKFSGILPGCNEYAGYITYQLFADAPGFDISKSVVGDDTTVTKGDVVTFKVRYDNTGTMNQNNVVVRDTLPEGLEYVAGSAILYNNNFTDGKPVNDDIISEAGMNIGDYAGGDGWAEITYQATVKNTVNCNDTLTNNVTVSTNDGNKRASLTLTVDGEECNVIVKTCATNPEMEGCQQLPNTGPVQIALASALAAVIGGGIVYVIYTQNKLRKVRASVSGPMNPANTSTQGAAAHASSSTPDHADHAPSSTPDRITPQSEQHSTTPAHRSESRYFNAAEHHSTPEHYHDMSDSDSTLYHYDDAPDNHDSE